jgi:hypothetical protein
MPSFKIKRRLFSLDDTFYIRNESNAITYVVKQSILSSVLGVGFAKLVRSKSVLLPGIDSAGFSKLVFYDPSEQYTHIVVRQRLGRWRPAFTFERNGITFAKMKEKINMWSALVCGCCHFGRRFAVKFSDGTTPPLEIRWRMADFIIMREGNVIGRVCRARKRHHEQIMPITLAETAQPGKHIVPPPLTINVEDDEDEDDYFQLDTATGEDDEFLLAISVT